jgi:hypothetical protein
MSATLALLEADQPPRARGLPARPAVGLAGHEKGASRRSLCAPSVAKVSMPGQAALRSIWHVVVAGGASGYIGGACAVANPMISVRAASIVTYVMRTCRACLDRWAVLDALRPFAVQAVRATPPVTYVMRARGARCDRWPTVQAPAQPAWGCEIIRPRGLATEPPPILRRNESFQVAALTRLRRNDPPGHIWKGEGQDQNQNYNDARFHFVLPCFLGCGDHRLIGCQDSNRALNANIDSADASHGSVISLNRRGEPSFSRAETKG